MPGLFSMGRALSDQLRAARVQPVEFVFIGAILFMMTGAVVLLVREPSPNFDIKGVASDDT